MDDSEIIMDLPDGLGMTIKVHIFEKLINSSNLFPKDDKGPITFIISKLSRKIYSKNEFIIRKGEIGNEMFFIIQGEV